MGTLSIAMATYNGERFIGEQLESFLRQSVLPNELVVTDDGSTDRTIEIIQNFAATAPFPVRIEKNTERLGYRGNFMKAASLCTSDFISFSDQDDVWAPEKVEKCLNRLKEDDVLLVHHNATIVNATLEPTAMVEKQSNLPTLHPAHTIEPWKFALGFTMVFHRRLLAFTHLWPKSSDFYFFNTREGHDQWYCFLASCLGSTAYINEPLTLYRQHGNNTFGWNTQNEGTFVHNFVSLAGTSLDGLKTRELAAGARAYVLEQMQDKLESPFKERAYVASNGYRKLEERYRTRQQFYSSKNKIYKAKQIAAMIQQGSYQPRHKWGVGPKAFVRDVVYGLILPARSK